jgi:hypothetical protein
MKKKSGKSKRARARAVKDLTVSDVRQVKGGVQDGTSNTLLTATATGKHFPKVILTT